MKSQIYSIFFFFIHQYIILKLGERNWQTLAWRARISRRQSHNAVFKRATVCFKSLLARRLSLLCTISFQFLFKMPVKTSVTSNVVVVVDRLRGGWTRLMQWAGTAQAQSPPTPPSTPSTAPGSILDRFNKV